MNMRNNVQSYAYVLIVLFSVTLILLCKERYSINLNLVKECTTAYQEEIKLRDAYWKKSIEDAPACVLAATEMYLGHASSKTYKHNCGCGSLEWDVMWVLKGKHNPKGERLVFCTDGTGSGWIKMSKDKPRRGKAGCNTVR